MLLHEYNLSCISRSTLQLHQQQNTNTPAWCGSLSALDTRTPKPSPKTDLQTHTPPQPTCTHCRYPTTTPAELFRRRAQTHRCPAQHNTAAPVHSVSGSSQNPKRPPASSVQYTLQTLASMTPLKTSSVLRKSSTRHLPGLSMCAHHECCVEGALDVVHQVVNGALACGCVLGGKAQACEHGQATVLELLQAQLLGLGLRLTAAGDMETGANQSLLACDGLRSRPPTEHCAKKMPLPNKQQSRLSAKPQ